VLGLAEAGHCPVSLWRQTVAGFLSPWA
jgi:hypothetical protein